MVLCCYAVVFVYCCVMKSLWCFGVLPCCCVVLLYYFFVLSCFCNVVL